MAALLPDRRALTSLFFGGGTPSLMPPNIVAKIISHAEKTFGFSPAIEITAEANPTSVEAKVMTEFFHAGVNRVSMGVQSFDNEILQFLGRQHDAAEALFALQTVRHNFDNLSIDLIYATAGETIASWRKSLSHALSLALPHLSLYQLTIEPGTAFFTRQRTGEQLHLDDDHAADLFELTQGLTADAGLMAYEISNHARPGAECQHNLNYWNAGDWIGIGPGAHGRFLLGSEDHTRIQRVGTATRRSPTGWLNAVQTNGHGIDTHTTDTVTDYAAEMMMMGLRLADGVKIDRIEALCGPQDDWLDQAALTQAIADGWLDLQKDSQTGSDTQLCLTAAGRLRINHILAMILR